MAFANLNSPFHTVMLVCLVATISYLAAKLGGTLVVRPQMNWALWPGNVLLVSVLLLVRRRIWPLLIAAAFAAFVLYDLQAGVSLRSTGLLILADAMEVLTAALCLSYSFGDTPELNSVKALAKYSFFAVFLAPFLGAFFGALPTEGDYWTSWRISFFSEALGFLILVPAILGWVRKILAREQKPQAYYLEASVLLAALIFVGYFAFAATGRNIPSALLYSPVPFLLWSALRFESVGVGTSVLVVGFLSIWGAVHGRGPFIDPGSLKSVSSLQLFLFFTAAPFMFLAVLVEENKTAGQALKKSEEKFSKAFRQGPLSLTLTSAKDYRYIEVNETFERITGWSREEVIGRTPFDIGLWVDPSQKTVLAERLLAEVSVRNLEIRFRAKSGVALMGLMSAELIEVDGEPSILSAAVDITDLKRAEEVLSTVSRRLIEAHEEERSWIARELHDDFNQRIAMLAVNLDRLKQELPASAVAVSKGLAEIHGNISELAGDVQALSHRLHSSKLEYLGIAAAASSFCKELSEKQGVEIDFHSEGLQKSLSQEIALCLFRVLQEAVQNALKHSGSGQIQVSLVGTSSAIELRVRDAGIGFEPEQVIKGRGLGLVSMKERLKLVEGALSIESQLQHGTTIHARVPLNPERKSACA